MPVIRSRQILPGFSLLELLVVVSIIATLTSLLLPGLESSRRLAQSTACLSNLHGLGVAGTLYQQDNAGSFWPYDRMNYPATGVTTYFWGSATSPVDFRASWLMGYLDNAAGHLQCPALPWGSYVPQGGVTEPTTAYGYNAWCFDPTIWGRRDRSNAPMTTKRITQITAPGSLFVFADAAMFWSPGGVPVLQNSTSLDPVKLQFGPNKTPTTHFRHLGQTNALSPDGHSQSYALEGGSMLQPQFNLGFVGTSNVPHYDQD